MGRTSWGTTNLGISSKLYNSCFRSRGGYSNCNLSMSDNYTIAQWNVLSGKKERKFLNCF